jgi:hypothetical protein
MNEENAVEIAPGMVFVVAESEVVPSPNIPAVVQPVVNDAPLAHTKPQRGGGVPMPLATSLALIAAIVIVALPAVILDLFSTEVLFAMFGVALIATSVAVIAYPVPPNQMREEFLTLSSEPVGQCTPSRNTLTGRG